MAFQFGIPKKLIKRVSEIEIDTHYYDKDVIPNSQDVFTYTLDSKKENATITGFARDGFENVVIPFEIHYDTTSQALVAKVISLSENCFSNNNVLKTITLPNTIHEIPSNCFINCSDLRTINIPSSVNIIKSGAFYNCDMLNSVFIPFEVSEIENGAFLDCANLKIICYKHSCAEEYAIENNIPYSLISYTLDEEVTKNSENLVTSGAIYNAILWEHGSGENSLQIKDSYSTASGYLSIASGETCEASGFVSHAEGSETVASGQYSHSEGVASVASGNFSHAEGGETVASGRHSHSEGCETESSGQYSHAEGHNTHAVGHNTHAEGDGTRASGNYSHAEGTGTFAVGNQSHAEGSSSMANGQYSHAEGCETKASGIASHSEGDHSDISINGECGHAEGDHTVVDNIAEHAEGRFNKSNHATSEFGNAGNTLHSVGIGTGTENVEHIIDRKNAFEIMQNGDTYMIGVGGYDGTNPSTSTTIQDVINSGSHGTSNLIILAKNVDMTYEPGSTEENGMFYANCSTTMLPNDYTINPYRYNLIVEVHGSVDDMMFGYTANHFCYLSGEGLNGTMAQCSDIIPTTVSESDSDIIHFTHINISNDNVIDLSYKGLMGEYKSLPTVGSKVSIYLQPLY